MIACAPFLFLVLASQPDSDSPDGAFAYRVSAQARLRSLHLISIHYGGADVGLGWRTQDAAIYGGLDLAFGSTVAGLSSANVRGKFAVEVEVGRIWLGGFVTLGYLQVRRATGDADLGTGTLGGGLVADIDLLRFDAGALFLGLLGSADLPNLTFEGSLQIGWHG